MGEAPFFSKDFPSLFFEDPGVPRGDRTDRRLGVLVLNGDRWFVRLTGKSIPPVSGCPGDGSDSLSASTRL